MSPDALFALARDSLATPFVTFFVVVDPIGLLPVFIALTAGFSPARRRQVALNALLISAGVLALFGLAGEAALGAIGVGLPAFRISGGVMLFMIAVEMLFEKRSERRSKTASDAVDEKRGAADAAEAVEEPPDPTVFPLATPLIAGPGAMASMILVTARAPSAAAEAMVYVALGAVLLLTYLCFLVAGPIERLLGPTGVKLVTRLFGVLLGALAVQFILDGLADFGFVAKAAGDGA